MIYDMSTSLTQVKLRRSIQFFIFFFLSRGLEYWCV